MGMATVAQDKNRMALSQSVPPLAFLLAQAVDCDWVYPKLKLTWCLASLKVLLASGSCCCLFSVSSLMWGDQLRSWLGETLAQAASLLKLLSHMERSKITSPRLSAPSHALLQLLGIPGSKPQRGNLNRNWQPARRERGCSSPTLPAYPMQSPLSVGPNWVQSGQLSRSKPCLSTFTA